MNELLPTIILGILCLYLATIILVLLRNGTRASLENQRLLDILSQYGWHDQSFTSPPDETPASQPKQRRVSYLEQVESGMESSLRELADIEDRFDTISATEARHTDRERGEDVA